MFTRVVRTGPCEQPPCEHHRVNNGAVFAELLSGIPLDRFLQERLCKPLRMVDTGFSVPPQQVINSRAFLHSECRRVPALI